MHVKNLTQEMLEATEGTTPLVTVGNDPDGQGVPLSHAAITVTDGKVLLSGQDDSGDPRKFDENATVVFSTY